MLDHDLRLIAMVHIAIAVPAAKRRAVPSSERPDTDAEFDVDATGFTREQRRRIVKERKHAQLIAKAKHDIATKPYSTLALQQRREAAKILANQAVRAQVMQRYSGPAKAPQLTSADLDAMFPADMGAEAGKAVRDRAHAATHVSAAFMGGRAPQQRAASAGSSSAKLPAIPYLGDGRPVPVTDLPYTAEDVTAVLAQGAKLHEVDVKASSRAAMRAAASRRPTSAPVVKPRSRAVVQRPAMQHTLAGIRRAKEITQERERLQALAEAKDARAAALHAAARKYSDLGGRSEVPLLRDDAFAPAPAIEIGVLGNVKHLGEIHKDVVDPSKAEWPRYARPPASSQSAGAANLYCVEYCSPLPRCALAMQWAALKDEARKHQLAVSSSDMTISFWDTKLFNYLGHVNADTPQTMMVWVHSANVLVSGSDLDPRLYVWDAYAHTPRYQLNSQGASLTALCDCGSTQIVASGDIVGRVKLWTYESHDSLPGDLRLLGVFKEHSAAVRHITYVPSMRALVSSCMGEDSLVWNPRLHAVIARIHVPRERLTYQAMSPGYTGLMQINERGTLRIWHLGDTTTGMCPCVLTCHLGEKLINVSQAALIMPAGRMVIMGAQMQMSEMQDLDALGSHTERVVVSVALQRCVVAQGGVLHVFDVTSGQCAAVWRNCFADSILSLALSADQRFVLAGDAEGNVKVFNLLTGMEMAALPGAHSDDVVALSSAPGAVQTLSASWDGSVYVYKDAGRRWHPLRSLHNAHSADLCCADVNYDLSLVATGCADGSVRIWKYDDFRTVGECIAHDAPVSAVLFTQPVQRVPVLISTDLAGRVCIFAMQGMWCQERLLASFICRGNLAGPPCPTAEPGVPAPHIRLDSHSASIPITAAYVYCGTEQEVEHPTTLLITGDAQGRVCVWDLTDLLHRLRVPVIDEAACPAHKPAYDMWLSGDITLHRDVAAESSSPGAARRARSAALGQRRSSGSSTPRDKRRRSTTGPRARSSTDLLVSALAHNARRRPASASRAQSSERAAARADTAANPPQRRPRYEAPARHVPRWLCSLPQDSEGWYTMDTASKPAAAASGCAHASPEEWRQARTRSDVHPARVWTAHTEAITDVKLVYIDGQGCVFTTSLDGACRVWRVSDGAALGVLLNTNVQHAEVRALQQLTPESCPWALPRRDRVLDATRRLTAQRVRQQQVERAQLLAARAAAEKMVSDLRLAPRRRAKPVAKPTHESVATDMTGSIISDAVGLLASVELPLDGDEPTAANIEVEQVDMGYMIGPLGGSAGLNTSVVQPPQSGGDPPSERDSASSGSDEEPGLPQTLRLRAQSTIALKPARRARVSRTLLELRRFSAAASTQHVDEAAGELYADSVLSIVSRADRDKTLVRQIQQTEDMMGEAASMSSDSSVLSAAEVGSPKAGAGELCQYKNLCSELQRAGHVEGLNAEQQWQAIREAGRAGSPISASSPRTAMPGSRPASAPLRAPSLLAARTRAAPGERTNTTHQRAPRKSVLPAKDSYEWRNSSCKFVTANQMLEEVQGAGDSLFAAIRKCHDRPSSARAAPRPDKPIHVLDRSSAAIAWVDNVVEAEQADARARTVQSMLGRAAQRATHVPSRRFNVKDADPGEVRVAADGMPIRFGSATRADLIALLNIFSEMDETGMGEATIDQVLSSPAFRDCNPVVMRAFFHAVDEDRSGTMTLQEILQTAYPDEDSGTIQQMLGYAQTLQQRKRDSMQRADKLVQQILRQHESEDVSSTLPSLAIKA